MKSLVSSLKPGCIAATMLLTMPSHAGGVQPPPGEFRMVDGRVDAGTYTGWRLFHSVCHVCHGMDAVGTDRAPDLVAAIDTMTPRSFAQKVLASYGLIAQLGATGPGNVASANELERLNRVMERERTRDVEVTMPAWGEDARVRPHVLDLYAYLTARAEGLSKGEPKLIETGN